MLAHKINRLTANVAILVATHLGEELMAPDVLQVVIEVSILAGHLGTFLLLLICHPGLVSSAALGQLLLAVDVTNVVAH